MRYWLGLIGCTLLIAFLASSAGAAEAMRPEAREQYRLGLELYDERQYEEALEKFRASNVIYPSPNSQLYVARCLRSIGRTAEAIEAYESTVRIAGDRAATDLRYEETWRAARQELAVLKPTPPPEQRFVVATWTSAAVSVVGLASFGTFWALARSRYNSLENNCNPLPCPASQTGAVETGRNYQLVANISLAVGITGAATAVTLYVLGRPRTTSWGHIALVGTTLQYTGEL
jgi:tetratricopeptide (TPR) repeat protein